MKKILIGCAAIVLLVVALVVGGLIYVGVKARSLATGFQTQVDNLKQLDQTYTFAAPADGSLDEARLETYFDIRTKMVEKVQSNQTIKKLIDSANTGTQPNLGVTEMLSLVFNFPKDALSEFNRELNAAKMSPSEYVYNARTVYLTARNGAQAGDREMKNIYDSVSRIVEEVNLTLQDNPQTSQHQVNIDRTLQGTTTMTNDVLAKNIMLLKAHEEEITGFPVLAFFEFMLINSDAFRPRQQPVEAPAPAP